MDITTTAAGDELDEWLQHAWEPWIGDWCMPPPFSTNLDAAMVLARWIKHLGHGFRFAFLTASQQADDVTRWWPDLWWDIEPIHVARAAETLWYELRDSSRLPAELVGT